MEADSSHLAVHRTTARFYVGGVVLATGVFILDLNLPLGVAGGMPYILLVMMTNWAPKVGQVYLAAALATLLTIVGYFLSPPGAELWQVLTNRSWSIVGIWVAAGFAIKSKIEFDRALNAQQRLAKSLADLEIRNDELQKAIGAIKTISGIVPICAWCGSQIKNDDGEWVGIEKYFGNHTDARISHGMCPRCSERQLEPKAQGLAGGG